MNKFSLLEKLVKIGPRVAENETKAYQLIQQELTEQNIEFILQPFSVDVPICKKAELIVDGENIPCLGSSLVSGVIPDGEYLISHFGYSGEATPYNIAYSPMTENISVVDHFRIPSLTISRESVVKIVMAQSIKGFVEVERTKTKTGNILVGNLNNPVNIVIAHFDSIIGPGAVDNAGSVAVIFQIILDDPQLLESTLFVFSGNEEMAYDEYKLSGYGFRIFEKDYTSLLINSKKIIVLDGVGVSDAMWSQSGIDWVLQVKMLDKIRDKVYWLQNDQTPILKIFHTSDDKLEKLSDEFLNSAEKLLESKLLS